MNKKDREYLQEVWRDITQYTEVIRENFDSALGMLIAGHKVRRAMWTAGREDVITYLKLQKSNIPDDPYSHVYVYITGIPPHKWTASHKSMKARDWEIAI